MEAVNILHVVTGLALALTLGGMTFFSAVLAPLVFIKLPPETAGSFIRQVFPWYYLSMAATTLIALTALLFVPGMMAALGALLTAMVLAGFVIARQVLMPKINRARDAMLAGDQAAGPRFNRLHRLSVMINACQWLAVFAALTLVLL
ncbi:MAG: DUF4149 domain-containing protein [Gammaproteobacteria bacterium]|nr:DUF4149 domain-containing protein [Gammaproteobacteria bacterium]